MPRKGLARVYHRKPPGEMNKLETKFSEHLAKLKSAGLITHWAYEPVKFQLAKRTTYTPDFLVIENGHVHFYETKGFMAEAGNVKIKATAETYWYFKFSLVYAKTKKEMKEDPGAWKIREIKPKGIQGL